MATSVVVDNAKRSPSVRHRSLALLGLSALISSIAPARADPDQGAYSFAKTPPKIALVVGNDAYRGAAQLPGSRTDAANMATDLGKLGFDVTIASHFSTHDQFEYLDLLPFISKIDEGSVVVFYYSGHGMNYGGESYLVPLQVPNDIYDQDVFNRFVSTTQLRNLIAERRPALLVMLLDACRDIGSSIRIEPRPGAAAPDFVAKGLALPHAVSDNMVIAYSAEAGATAQGSATGGLSVYTDAVLQTIGTPDLMLDAALKMIRVQVRAATQMQQSPWVSDSSSEFFYFNPTEQTNTDIGMLWASALHVGSSDAVERFIAYYGASSYGAAARKWLSDHPSQASDSTGSSISPADLDAAWGTIAPGTPTGKKGASLTALSGIFKWNQTMDVIDIPGSANTIPKPLADASGAGAAPPDDVQNAFEESPTPRRTEQEKVATAIAGVGEAVLTTNLMARILPKSDASTAGSLPSGTVLKIDGFSTDEQNNVWVGVKPQSGGDNPVYIKVPKTTKETKIDVGSSLRELDIGAIGRVAGIVDAQSLIDTIKSLKSDNRSVSWISLSTPAGENKRERDIFGMAADYLKLAIENSGIANDRILILHGTGSEKKDIHVKIFGQ